MLTEPLYTEYTRMTTITVFAVMVKLDSINVVTYPDLTTGKLKCNMRTNIEYIDLPLVHELSEEEYFQNSLIFNIDFGLLRSIQKHAIEVIESNGKSVLFMDYMHNLKDYIRYSY